MKTNRATFTVSVEILREFLQIPAGVEVVGVALSQSRNELTIRLDHPFLIDDSTVTPIYTRHEDGSITSDWSQR